MVQPAAVPPICGIDEAGRGPLAGPVYAAAVVLPAGFPVGLLADSKRLSPERREELRSLIDRGARVGIGHADAAEIDRLNIHHATLAAMRRAWEALCRSWPERMDARIEIRVDGRFCPDVPVRCEALVGGDALVPAIMAASIVAKTERDRWMIRYAEREPRYGFELHKGYPTAAHREAIARHGPCPIHRRTFRGVTH